MLAPALLLAQVTTALAGVLLVSTPHAPATPAARPAVALVPAIAPAVLHVRPAARPRKAAAPRVRHRALHRATAVRRVVSRPRTRTTSAGPQASMDAAVARLPGYQPGSTSWVLSRAYGSWGAADWYHDTVYVSPSVPNSRMYDVVAHEWSHILSVRPYGGDIDVAVGAMDSWFGGRGFTGAERAADCMARLLGARWTEYTSCSDSHWRDGARKLLAGHKLT